MNGFLPRAVLLLAVLLLATVAGLVRRRRAGRAREVSSGEVLTVVDLAEPAGTVSSIRALGERGTFVQFSSPACSPCRAVHRVLTTVVAENPGWVHVDVDATQRLDLARRVAVMRTPTVLVLDPTGRVVRRISGALTADQARAAVFQPIIQSSRSR